MGRKSVAPIVGGDVTATPVIISWVLESLDGQDPLRSAVAVEHIDPQTGQILTTEEWTNAFLTRISLFTPGKASADGTWRPRFDLTIRATTKVGF